MFGGFDNNNRFLNDLWCFKPDSLEWMKKMDLTIGRMKGIHSHSACVNKGKMFLWGGSIDGESFWTDVSVSFW